MRLIMKLRTIVCTLAASICYLAAAMASASEIVYTPINPTFGGNALNGSFLLGKANAQNEFAQDAANSADRFEQRLENAILSQLARRIVDAAFGTGSGGDLGEGGTFITGDFSIDIDNSDPQNIIVTITNLLTGEVTIIEVPIYNP